MSMEQVEVLRAAVCLAAKDERISEREGQILQKLREAAGVGEASFRAMVDMAREDPDYHERQLRFILGDPSRTWRVLLHVANADGQITQEEHDTLRIFAEKLGVPAENVPDVSD
ncbi:MAG: hypothetical protein AAGD00_00260 [Planctomycetota bacterium]